MEQLTKQAVKDLQKKTGHAILAEDFDLIEELDAIAKSVSRVSKAEHRLLKQPLTLCGIKFYPMTVAKSLWFAEKVEEWGVEPVYQEAMMFWLLTLPNTSDALDDASTRKGTDKAVKRLSRKLHCTTDEMTDVFNRCLGIREQSKDRKAMISDAIASVILTVGEGDDGTEAALVRLAQKLCQKEPSDTDYGGMVACLLREYGGTPNEWLYETPVETISALLQAYSAKVEAENGVNRHTAAKGGMAIAPKFDATIAMLSRFRAKVRDIETIWGEN